MELKIYDNSKNYACQVIKLPTKIKIPLLDNLVEVNFQGNSCLVGKDSNEEELYLFFPAECKISSEFLRANNLYRHKELNQDQTKQGFFEDSGRVKALKFKGIISTGFIIPLYSLPVGKDKYINMSAEQVFSILKVGDEFNSINDFKICEKYVKPSDKKVGMSNPRTKVLDNIVDSRMAPEHPDTSHLMKNIHKLNLNDYIAVSYKLHGTSARYYNTLVKRKLTWKDKLGKFFGIKVVEEQYDYISASRKVVKSVGFEALPDKNHFFTSGDLWSEVGKEYFDGKLNQGEAVYCEIIGKTYTGETIQHGYSYGFEKPKVYIYRISNINSQGIEIDLSYQQMKERSIQLGIDTCPEYFYGTLENFLLKFGAIVQDSNNLESHISNIFYTNLLEHPSILDSLVIEEGFCIRKDTYGKPEIFKVKSKKFLAFESGNLDKEVIDVEQEESI